MWGRKDKNDRPPKGDQTQKVGGPGDDAQKPLTPRSAFPKDAPAPPVRPDIPPPRGNDAGGDSGLANRYSNPTEILRPEAPAALPGGPGAPGAPPPPNRPDARLGGMTQIVRPGMSTEGTPPPRPEESPDDLVVGWLVVIEGPGYGRAMDLGYGRNSVGRNSSNRVAIDFGDPAISGDNHCFILYDGRGRGYYLQSGESVNLTYLNDEPVLSPVKLNATDHIQIGATTLRFIPLCGDGFDWSDEQIAKKSIG